MTFEWSRQARLRFPDIDRTIIDRYPIAPSEEIARWATTWGVEVQDIRRRARSLGVRRDPIVVRELNKPDGPPTKKLIWFLDAGLSMDRDAEYVALCRAQGGFPVRMVIDGRTYDVRAG